MTIPFTAMAGSDPTTARADDHRRDYAAGPAGASLKGKRLGVLSFTADISPEVNAAVAQAVALLKAQGAEVIEPAHYKLPRSLRNDELTL